MLRFGDGERFQKEHTSDPCPDGWFESIDRGYCEKFGDPEKQVRGVWNGPPKAANSGLYSSQAYIPRVQHHGNQNLPEKNNYSDSTFIRSYDYRSGNYSVFYEPHPTSKVTTYLPMVLFSSPKKRYDTSWDLPPQKTTQKLARLKVSDSYL